MPSPEAAVPPAATPRVSFVVPCFNEPAGTLEISLDSMRDQTVSDFECLVIDESTDPAAAQACQALCARDARFHYRRPDRRLGLAASLNWGIELARAPIVARFDSDDICAADRLALQLAFLDAHPEVGVVGGALQIIREDGQALALRHYPQDHAGIERGMQWKTTLAHPTVAFRKALVQEAGGYNPAFRFAEDLDLWLRLLNRGVRFANLPQVLVRYRQNDTRRQAQHWAFNLRARTGNWSWRLPLRRLAGITAVAVWRYMPAPLQTRVFDLLVLARQRH